MARDCSFVDSVRTIFASREIILFTTASRELANVEASNFQR